MSSQSAVAKQRKVQDEVDKADKKHGKEGGSAMQAGARHYPAPPLPKQRQEKPGKEYKLDPPPMYDAPYYKGSDKLKDKAAIVTGGDSGIGRAVAVLFAREGADVAIVFLESERKDAEETKKAVEKEGRRCLLIAGDVRDREFCKEAVEETVREF